VPRLERIMMRLAIAFGFAASAWAALPLIAHAQQSRPETVNDVRIESLMQQQADLLNRLGRMEATNGQIEVLRTLVESNKEYTARVESSHKELQERFNEQQWQMVLVLVGLLLNLVFTYRARQQVSRRDQKGDA
jgi:hypothetical protein